MSYQHGARYEDGYGYAGGYDDPWGASQYRRGYDNYRYQGGYGYRDGYGYNSQYSRDPRTHYLRHCPDGSLAPYTTPCRAFAQPGRQGQGQHQLGQPLPQQSLRHPPPMQRQRP